MAAIGAVGVDQEHAADMRQALMNLNSDLVQEHPDYVCRVTADEVPAEPYSLLTAQPIPLDELIRWDE